VSDLGGRIRARRKELGWSLDRLAGEAGLSKGFLCDLERGKRGVGADSLLRVGNALGLPLDQLMKGTHEPYHPDRAVKVDLPQTLLAFAMHGNVPFREVMALYWMARTVTDHRTNGRKRGLEEWDWKAFHEAVRAFL
jgi:transcriptional regulator with XRE-family HTH domain